MIVPKPPVKLEGHCSVVYDNTLYTYSENGFASIPLSQNATWRQLEMGEPVSGAACVTGVVDGSSNKQALYVIGGKGSTSPGYSGLQSYTFQDKKWKSISLPTKDMADRTHHGAAYLKSSSTILVYGGSQDGGTDVTSQNFVIQTSPEYNLLTFPIHDIPPAASPVLLPWSDDQVALFGGATDTKSIHLFQYADNNGTWHKSNASLAQSIPSNVQCALLRGSDGSKVLESFDLGASPNTVSSVVLINSDGEPAKPGQTAGTKSKRKRASTLKNYPSYDDSLASKTTRSQYSLAQGDNGLVVFSSGSGTDSLSIFNQTSNSWVNSTKLFYGDESEQQILATTTPTPTPSASPSPSASSLSAPAAADDHSGSKVGTIVGATLGAVVGAAVILVLILFFLKAKKDKKKQAANGQGQGGSNDKDRLSFQDQGMEPLTQSAYPMAKSPIPMATSSVDSLAIFSGKAGKDKAERSSGLKAVVTGKSQPKASPLSTVQSNGEVTANSAYDAEAQDSSLGQPGDRRTNEGWSKYFQDNNATDIVGIQSDSNDRDTAKAQARQSAWPMTSLTPLNFGFLDEPKPLGQVFSGSPTTENPSEPGRGLVIPESQSARISSADSISLTSDEDYARRERYSSGFHDSQWTGAGQNSWLGRPPSSTYSESHYNPSVRHSVAPNNNARRSSVLIPDTLDEPPHNTMSNDMSWLNLNADR